MDISKQIIEQISELTTIIEVNYPELYVFLDENPLTISNSEHPQITSEILNDYLESLKQLLTNYQKTHKYN